MSNKINIEEIKLLLPDYITGSLNDEERQKVENAIASSTSLKELYLELKNALEFAGSVEAEEPAPQYWNSLLPRIHEKLDAKENKRAPSYIWKVLLPAAAVVLLFIIYRISFTPETEISKKETETEKIEKFINKDTAEKKIETPVQEKKDVVEQHKTVVKPRQIKHSVRDYTEENLENNYNQQGIIEKTEIKNELPESDDLASVAEDDDYSIFGAGVQGMLDDETYNELDKLNDSEQNDLLETLSKSNL